VSRTVILDGKYPLRIRWRAVEEPIVPPPPTTITFVVWREDSILLVCRYVILRMHIAKTKSDFVYDITGNRTRYTCVDQLYLSWRLKIPRRSQSYLVSISVRNYQSGRSFNRAVDTDRQGLSSVYQLYSTPLLQHFF
jgi:hypothetical protein